MSKKNKKSKPPAPKPKLDGKVTSIESATPKERVFVVNGLKFFAAVTEAGFRILSACDENKKLLQSAERVLIIKGYTTKVKRSKENPSLWILEAKEKTPSGPWPDEDYAPPKEVQIPSPA